ncbi:MAG: hypothetical protein MUD12_10115 [Spirochaetes bacterium]|jgi:hypothetical protein|nr:hypothetical protein [Spirochaetota bacterium]
MKIKPEKLLPLAVLFFFRLFSVNLLAADQPRESVAIIPVYQQIQEFNLISERSCDAASEMFMSLGRYYPVDRKKIAQNMDLAKKEGSINIKRLIELLGVELCVLIKCYPVEGYFAADLEIIPASEETSGMRKSITVRSRIPSNIAYKIAREIAYIHSGLDVRARVIEKSGNLHIIDAGQWHGLNPGKYSTDAGTIMITETGRYVSLAELTGEAASKKRLTIHSSPKISGAVKQVNDQIDSSTGLRYAFTNIEKSKSDDFEKRFVESFCVINMGANTCLPGYGSYLTSEYLGYKKTDPDLAGVFLSAALILNHHLLPEFITGFKVNYFPWVMDRDKTKGMQNLQIFLWSTIPVTFSASYIDQLASLYEKSSQFPPFYREKDSAALALSVFIPGGGLFYKGYRIPGWGFYFAEMAIAGYGAYNARNARKARYAFPILGGIKIIDLALSYLLKPNYSFYKLEMEREAGSSSFSFSMRETEKGGMYSASMNFLF